VCEGHTERDYFQRLNKWYGEEYGFSIHLAPRKQRHDKSFPPLAAVKEAVRRSKDLRGAQRKNVWAVFDRDEHTDIYKACRLAREEGINIAFSHPHFELWLWLHFASGVPGRLDGDRTWVPEKLAGVRGFKDFHKRLDESHFALLRDRKRAVRLARELVDRCPSGCCSAKGKAAGEPAHAVGCDVLLRDPSTDVYRILEFLHMVETP